jgi:PAS domain S-box-containing protein
MTEIRTANIPSTGIADLRARLEELEETLRAIRSGEVDALVVSGKGEERIFTLQGAEHPYRVRVEEMNEGAATLVEDGTVIYSNRRFSQMLGVPLEKLIGASLFDFLESAAGSELGALLRQIGNAPRKVNTHLRRPDHVVIPVSLSLSQLKEGDFHGLCMIVTDLTEHEQRETELARTNQRLREEVAQRTAAEDAMRREEESLRILSGRLLQLQDHERRHIARALHDSMGQELTAIKIGLQKTLGEHARNPAICETLSESVEGIDRALMQVRNLSLLLHPPMLDEVGLSSALRWFVDGIAQRSNIQVKLDISSPWERLSPELETTVYRIVQECLTNVYRHSQSTFADIRVAREPDRLLVAVRDGGKGLPADIMDQLSKMVGVGIGGMRERVRQFGGQLKISPADPGTIVEATIPIGKPYRNAKHSGEAA